MFEGLDSRLRVCTRSRRPKIAIEITDWRKKFWSRLRHNRTLLWTLYLDPLFCVKGALQLITWVLTHGRAARGNPTTAYINTLLRYTVLEILIVGLDTNITKNHLNMFPEILNFFLNILKSSKYIKTIWLHFINSTVKTPKICLSPEMKTQI